jgi:DNA-binding NarL/FixJ family response regulator
MRVAMGTADRLQRGRAAFHAHAWAEACGHLSAADDESPLDRADLELLATSAFLAGDDDLSLDSWVRAHNEWLRVQRAPRAVRCTFWMILELLSSGEWARANGWLATARRLLDEGPHDCAERGLLSVIFARVHLKDGNHTAAHDVLADAVALADRLNDPDLKAFGRLAQGQVHARRGEAAAAVTLFDEAMVAVTTDDVSPITVGVVYCAVIESCYEILDLGRAREWTAALVRWCGDQPDLVPFRGHCFVHHAETLRRGGAWSSAMTEAGEACRRGMASAESGAPVQSSQSRRGYPVGAAFYELAEIHRMRGKFAEAGEAYRQASLHGRSPEPGLALLRLAEGRSDAAATAIRRVLDQPQKRWARTDILAAGVEIMMAVRDLAAARAAADELRRLAVELPALFLQATAAQAAGTVLLAERDPRAALAELRAAWMAYQELEMPFDAARVRTMMGVTCRELGDEDAAALEFDAARHVFLRLEATPYVAQVDRLLADSPTSVTPRLTARELQVIRLLAAGRTNRAIARQLTISERTVDRHVSNILTKLDLPSRTAATAYAYQHHLV